GYQRAPGPEGHAHPVVALRLTVGSASGPIATSFGVGGVSAGVVALGFGATAGGARDFPVRGYPVGVLFGQRAATASVEYRLPLALVGQAVGHLPFGVDRLWLSVFGDVGDAWEPGAAARLHRLRSAGVEFVADLTVSYDLPLGLRLGLAQPLADLPARSPGVTGTTRSATCAWGSSPIGRGSSPARRRTTTTPRASSSGRGS